MTSIPLVFALLGGCTPSPTTSPTGVGPSPGPVKPGQESPDGPNITDQNKVPPDITAEKERPTNDVAVALDTAWVAGFHIVRCRPNDPTSRPLFGRAPLALRRQRAVEPGSPEYAAEIEYANGLSPSLREWCFVQDDIRKVSPPARVPPNERDHIAVRMLAAPSPETEAYFGFDAMRVSALFGVFLPPTTAPAANTRARVTLVDTSLTASPTGTTGRTPFDRGAFSAHGSTLANAIGSAACSTDGVRGPNSAQSNCALEVATQLALPHRAVKPTGGGAGYVLGPVQATGGHVGTIAELATAISSAVVTYRTERGRPDAIGLVVNLSVGFGSAWDNAASSDVQTLHDALMDARCSGALILAAEGNGFTPGSPGNMLTPARWYTKANELGGTGGTGAHDCTGHLPPGLSVARWNLTSPLVYPVGGLSAAAPGSTSLVEPTDALPTGPWSTARAFVGPASARLPTFIDVPPTTGSDEFGLSVAGTSVSTALVSAAAAVRWGMGPGACSAGWPTTSPLAPVGGGVGNGSLYLAEEVMADVMRGCSGAGPTTPVRPSHADAFAAVQATSVIRTCEEGMTAECAKLEALTAAPTLTPATGGTCTSTSGVTGCTTTNQMDCGSTPRLTFCATTDVYATGSKPWVLPMPPPPHCPACVYDNGTLFTEFPPLIGATGGVASASLVLGSRTGSVTTRSAEYLDIALSTTGPTTVPLPAAPTGVNVAWLSVFDATGDAESCPVRVVGKDL